MVRVPVLSLVLVAAITVTAACYGQTTQTSASEQDVVSASTLKRTYTVQPTWPEAATGVEGWVRLRFTLLPNGTVADIEVEEAHPAGLFDASAVEALRQWKFEPVERDGKKIAQRAEIRMKYALPSAG
ncbi:energy transducer TonB [Peristeroidobacter agariperforans]|uniref:energy transducer TonB n=1 Tax=Peristeroidobacter agariperforans TaxID=268404 RepID=UPI00101CB8E8|nr:energy transducer TonB [Peristeroidobacter agariperforans]